MKTIKLTPTQKRELLAGIVTYRVKNNEDIIPFVGRNLGDFNYNELFETYLEKCGAINRELGDLYLNWKYPVAPFNEDQISKDLPTAEEIFPKETLKDMGDIVNEITPKKYSKLTEMETKVFDFLLEELEPWIGGEGYTDTDTKDIVKGTKIPATKLRGVLSSLEQKNILGSYEHDTSEDLRKRNWITLWHFVDQQDHSQESLIELVK